MNSSAPRCTGSKRSRPHVAAFLCLALVATASLLTLNAEEKLSDAKSALETSPPPLPETTSPTRPADWAVRVEHPGLPNCYRVTTNLYRGAQPTAQGMTELKKLGVKTIVNLRNFHSDVATLGETGLQQTRLKMEPWHASNDEVVQFLKIAADTNNYPIFVHCERGADRTGTMCAIYRIAICGWTKDEALKEMTQGGFGFNPAWQNLVNYVRKLDVEQLKKQAGLESRPPAMVRPVKAVATPKSP